MSRSTRLRVLCWAFAFWAAWLWLPPLGLLASAWLPAISPSDFVTVWNILGSLGAVVLLVGGGSYGRWLARLTLILQLALVLAIQQEAPVFVPFLFYGILWLLAQLHDRIVALEAGTESSRGCLARLMGLPPAVLILVGVPSLLLVFPVAWFMLLLCLGFYCEVLGKMSALAWWLRKPRSDPAAAEVAPTASVASPEGAVADEDDWSHG